MPKKTYRPYKAKKPKNWLRNPKDAKFYNSSVWRKFSTNYKQMHPVCEVEGCTKPSYYTDHIKPIADGGNKLDEDNVQALCKSCNSSKTSTQYKKLK